MKNMSFSNPDQSFYCKKSTELNNYYRNSELKAKEANQRIQEIKKKYDTPSRRDRIQSLKKSQNYGQHRTPIKEDAKQNGTYSKQRMSAGVQKYASNHHVPTFGTNPLKESFAVNRLQKSALQKEDCKQLDHFHKNYKESISPLGQKAMNLVEMKSHAMQEQEALFSKVREMKESLINQDIMKGSTNGRSNISSYKNNNIELRADHSAHNPHNSKPFDPRVQNIDKINSKIKQILSCLNQNEKNPSKYLKQTWPQRSTKDETRMSTLNSHLFSEKDDKVRNSFLHTENENSKIYAPFSNIPSQHKIQQSNVYNFYKNNDHAFSKSYQECSSTQNDQVYNHKYKPSVDVKNIQEKYGRQGQRQKQRQRQRQRQQRQYSEGRSQSYSSNIFKRKEQMARTPTCLQTKPFDQKSTINGSRSRSQMDNISRSGLSQNDKDLLRSGKKWGDQISRIQSKIEELENKKKKLNIQYTPFSMKTRSASVVASQNQPSSISSQKLKGYSKVSQKPSVPHFRSSSSTKQRHLTAHFGNHRQNQSHLQRSIAGIQDIHKSLQTEPVRPSFEVSLEQVDVDVRTVRIQKPEQTNEEASINLDSYNIPTPTMNKQVTFAYDEVRKRTDQGIQQRKKMLQHHQIIKTDSLKKLVHLFCEQAKLDENLRNLKIWFEALHDSHKFSKLVSCLRENGVDMTEKECQNRFKVQESQHNPFFTVQGYDGSMQNLVKAYKQCQNHWQSQVMYKFDKDNLQTQGFTKNKIDLQRKGFIQLQDLVRLLNIQSGTFYRNRDIFLIFRRLTQSDKTSFDDILKEIAA